MMANYGFIDMQNSLCAEAAERIILGAVRVCLDPRWQVKSEERGTWFVYLPGTEKRGRAARDAVLADGDPVGFLVELTDDKRFSFRHGPNRFERWAQGRLEEQMADDLATGVFYDATDSIKPPGTRYYRNADTYRGHIVRRLTETPATGPLTDDDLDYIERQMYCVPEGHRS